MDRVTRYPIFSNPHSARITGLALDGDTSYTIELVGVGPEASWSQDELKMWPTDREALLDPARTGVSPSRWDSPRRPAPWSLYEEDQEEEEVEMHHLGKCEALPNRTRNLEQERLAVIQGQKVRKGGTVAMLQRPPDCSNPRPSGQPPSAPQEETMVDREQIDFLAARQQFLSLEQAITNPVARVAPAHSRPGLGQGPKASNRPHLANGHIVPATPNAEEGVREEKQGCGFLSVSSVRAAGKIGSGSPGEPPEPPKETPIEREIRLAQEREAALREQRGLGRAPGYQELVQIPSRPVLSQLSLAEAPRRDRSRPSLYVQRDLAQETQRQEDHRREGLRVGRAPTPDWASEDPRPRLGRSGSSDSILGPAPDARAADLAPEVRKISRIPPDAYQPYLSPGTQQLEFSAFGVCGKPRGVSTETKAAVSPWAVVSPKHLSESSVRPLSTKQERAKPPGKPTQANGDVVRCEYFRLCPLRFGVPDAPKQAETPHVWGWEVAGAPVLKLHRSQSDLLEREVESVLRREREVAEERRNASFPEVFSTTPLDEGCEQDSRSSSRASGVMGSYSVSESPFFTPIPLHSGLEWTEEPPADRTLRQKKKAMWYAGINPSDSVNSEVLGATRVTRHKNALAERWEAGIYTSEDED